MKKTITAITTFKQRMHLQEWSKQVATQRSIYYGIVPFNWEQT